MGSPDNLEGFLRMTGSGQIHAYLEQSPRFWMFKTEFDLQRLPQHLAFQSLREVPGHFSQYRGPGFNWGMFSTTINSSFNLTSGFQGLIQYSILELIWKVVPQ